MPVRTGIISQNASQTGDGDVDLPHFLPPVKLAFTLQPITPDLASEQIVGHIIAFVIDEDLQQLKQHRVEAGWFAAWHPDMAALQVDLAC